MILIAAQVAQQHGRAVILRDEQVRGAVAVVVARNDSAWIFELNLVETNVGGDVFESVGAEVAKQAHFTLTFFRFADRDEIDPAIVVIVEGGDTEGTDPVGFQFSKLLKGCTVIVSPQSQRRYPRAAKRNIHPAVMVEIKDSGSRIQ